MDIENNSKNPTITKVDKIDVRHHFIIRYTNEEAKEQMIDLILQLVKEHEISDYYIEQVQAYRTNRILYNLHTLTTENESFNFNDIDQKFIKYLKQF